MSDRATGQQLTADEIERFAARHRVTLGDAAQMLGDIRNPATSVERLVTIADRLMWQPVTA